jgi:hypothetical protein
MTDLRIIDTPGGPVVPVRDIARQMGCSRTTISNILHRHPAVFSMVMSSEWLATPSGRQKHTCIAKSAVEDLISHLRPLNHDNLPERIDAFRASQIRKNVTGPALSDILAEYGRRARALATDWDVDLALARKISMAAAVEKYPDLTPYRALVGSEISQERPALPAPAQDPDMLPDPEFEKYFSMAQLARFCQCEEKDAYKILYEEGVLDDMNGHRYLTRYGERFARAFPHFPLWPHRLTRKKIIRYNPQAVQLIRGKLFGIQTTLAQKAAGSG